MTTVKQLFGASFDVAGVPKAQPRPRAFARKMGDTFVARVYEDGSAEGWKGLVLLAARPHRPESPLEGPVRVDITLWLPRPKRLLRRCDPDGVVWCTAKPDRDNADKAILDTLTQDGWWRDDAQVCAGEIQKFYHPKNERPGAFIVVCELPQEVS